MAINANDLFNQSANDGELSPGSATVLTGLGARINASLTPLVVAPTVTEETVLGVLMDNTPSTDVEVRDPDSGKLVNAAASLVSGHNLIKQSLLDAKVAESIEMLTQLINPEDDYISAITGGKPSFSWTPLRGAYLLNPVGYVHGYSTPLNDRTLELLGSAVARVKWWEEEYGVLARSLSLIMTDGQNNTGRASAADVKLVVQDMIRMEKHRIFFLGVDTSGNGVDFFRNVALNMGIPADCVDVIPNDPKKIRAKFQLFSQSAVQVSQSANVAAIQSIGFGGN